MTAPKTPSRNALDDITSGLRLDAPARPMPRFEIHEHVNPTSFGEVRVFTLRADGQSIATCSGKMGTDEEPAARSGVEFAQAQVEILLKYHPEWSLDDVRQMMKRIQNTPIAELRARFEASVRQLEAERRAFDQRVGGGEGAGG